MYEGLKTGTLPSLGALSKCQAYLDVIIWGFLSHQDKGKE